MTNDEYKAKCQWLSEFYAEAARTGRQMQMRIANRNWITNNMGPDAGCDASDWRLKPEPQKAWVVWYNGGGSIWITSDYEKAVSFANYNCSDSTIQEINRPD